MGDEPRDLAPLDPREVADRREAEEDREVRRLVNTVKREVVRKAKKVLDSVDDATLLADVAEPKRSLPSRTAFVMKMAEAAFAAESAQPGVQINISQQQTIILPPRQAPDYSNAITVEPSNGDDD